jgi:hypothetical protein
LLIDKIKGVGIELIIKKNKKKIRSYTSVSVKLSFHFSDGLSYHRKRSSKPNRGWSRVQGHGSSSKSSRARTNHTCNQASHVPGKNAKAVALFNGQTEKAGSL